MSGDDNRTSDQDLNGTATDAHAAPSKMPYGDVLRDIVKYLKEHPLLLFPLAAMILVAGAASVRGAETVRALTIPVLALAILGLLAWLYDEATRSRRADLRYLSADYGIEVTKPVEDSTSSQSRIDVEGRFSRQPPQGTLSVFTTDGKRFWPQRPVRLHPHNRWSTTAGLGDNPVELTVIIAIVGPSTRIWLDYYRKVIEFHQGKSAQELKPILHLDAWPDDSIKKFSINVKRIPDPDPKQ